MNPRIQLELIRKSKQRNDSGFVLPLVLMVGLIVAVIGVAVVIRGQADQTNVVSQKTKQVANASAEAGMARLQNIFSQNPALAKYSMKEWRDMVAAYNAQGANPAAPNADSIKLADLTSLLQQQSCAYSAQTPTNVKTAAVDAMNSLVLASSADADGTIQELSASTTNPIDAQSFKVKRYRYASGAAEAVIEGRAGNSGSPAGKATLSAVFPVNETMEVTQSGFPGLWVKEYLRAGQNNNNPGTLNAHVAYDCGMNPGSFTAAPITTGIASGYTSYVSSGTSGGGTAVRLALPTGNPAPERSLVPMPNPPKAAQLGIAPASIYNLGNVTGNLTLPRPGDAPVNGVYYYNVNSITGNTTNLQFKRGDKVTVFLSGNIAIGGKSQITHDCQSSDNTLACDATDVQILGSTENTKGSFITKGTSAVCSLFFWAPTYVVEMSGGGNAGACANKVNPAATNPPSQPANQNGIYWVRAWIGGGQGAHQALNQSGSGWDKIRSVASLPAVKVGVPTQVSMQDSTYGDDPAAFYASLPVLAVNRDDVKPPTGTCAVPNLVGTTLTDVNSMQAITAAIISAGLTGGVVTETVNTISSVPATQVTSQSLTAGSTVPCGTMISYNYQLANGQVPSLVGSSVGTGNSISLTTARNTILAPKIGATTESCFLVGSEVRSGEDNQPKIVGQNPAYNASAPFATCGLAINYTYAAPKNATLTTP